MAANPSVIACNLSSVPLPDASVDLGVFSLALMGTDYGTFLEEAHRVVKLHGRLWVAEVRSRFHHAPSGCRSEAEGLARFVQAMRFHGWERKGTGENKHASKMFVVLEFKKVSKKGGKKKKKEEEEEEEEKSPTLVTCSSLLLLTFILTTFTSTRGRRLFAARWRNWSVRGLAPADSRPHK